MKEIWYRNNKISIEKLFPAIHFVLTFFFERINFIFTNNWDVFVEVARKESVSDLAENVIVYCLSKLWALIIIYLIWKLFFAIIHKKIALNAVILFLIIYLFGAFVGLLNYPNLVSIDNYATYSYAIRFLPTYWHSIYTGALYAGCMMVLPHPFSIYLFCWLAFVGVVAYLYCNINDVFHGSNFRFLVLIFFVLPETYKMIIDPYRSCIYATLCLFYYAHIFFETKKGNWNSIKKLLIVALLSAFVMVWRSEGIILGFGGFCFVLINVSKLDIKRMAALLLVFVSAFVCLSKFQGLGAEKYFGRDYSIINTMAPLVSILNDPNANLSYEGADDDLEALEAVTPVEIIKQYGLSGFRSYNYHVRSHVDFNQSMVDDEISSKYMRAYYRILLHNLNDYLNVQINFFFTSLGVQARHTVYSYNGDEKIELNSFVYDFWKNGAVDLRESFLTNRWEHSSKRIYLNTIAGNLITAWNEFWSTYGLNTILHACMFLSVVMLTCVEFILAFVEKNKCHIGWFILWTTCFGEMCGIALFMPGGYASYIYPVLYSAYLFLCLYLIDKPLNVKKEKVK